MNLWAKRAGLLFSAAVLIFLISCEDDSYLLGFKGKTKFKGRYQELVFDGDKSSVILLDSVYTDQYDISASPVNPFAYRYLLGEYNDPDFGTVRSSLYTSILPNDAPSAGTKLNSPQGFDSVTVQLLFDYYAYGPEITINPEVLVYELSDSLSFFNRYENNSTFADKGVVIGRLKLKKLSNGKLQAINLSQLKYEELLDRDPSARDTLVLHGRLNLDGGEDIIAFEERLYLHIVAGGDSVLIGKYIPAFRKAYPGFAFVSAQSGRLLGFNPLNALSRLTIHYSSSTTDSLTTSLFFTPFPYVGANAFSKITTDRTGGLSGISVPNEPFSPSISDQRYIQDGSTVITELDLSDFYSFVDTLEDIIINSAEISMDVVSPPPGMSPPSSLYGVLMKKTLDNKIVALNIDVKDDSLKMVQFAGTIYTDLKNFGISTELSSSSPLTLSYSSSAGKYKGYATMFFQRLFDNKSNPEYNIEHLGFYPATAPILKILNAGSTTGYPLLKSGIGNSVNRALIKASGIKLKLYYTVPNKPNLE